MKTIFLISDRHYPHTEPALLEVAREVVASVQPDEIVINGDWFDCEQVSSYRKNAHAAPDLTLQLEQGRDAAEALFQAWPAKKVFVCGDHEERLERYLLDGAPALAEWVESLGGTRAILGLRVDDYVPYRHWYEPVAGVGITHGHRVSQLPVGTSRSHAAMRTGHVLVGHSHRASIAYETKETGPKLRVEMGHGTANPPGSSPNDNWQSTAGCVLTTDGDAAYAEMLWVAGSRSKCSRRVLFRDRVFNI